ncbi:LTA synthase family protein [Oceanihabitans sediminis]|uniref:LTA synthase family protein n=1 Tax=Oceanihabitans sediminis TaxID=1812012 RepID=UPI00299D5240|nr:LTA synthase family protein [Oceanihabitans sediminis]MDX1774101.1 LTA synthase family protein [Oceanihabitans sediminis]
MTNYYKSLSLFAKRILLVVIIYQLCRLLFLIFNFNTFNQPFFNTFLGGLRFDLSAIAYINILFAILHCVPGKFKYSNAYQKTLKVVFYSVNLLFIITNFIDFEYYKFTGRRSTFGMITAQGMEQEISGLIVSFLMEFWYLLLLGIALAIAFYKAIPNLKLPVTEQEYSKKDYTKQTLIFIGVMGLTLVLGRGGFQKKPLRIIDSSAYGALNHSALILNTPFCILKTLNKKEVLRSPNYFSKEELDTIFSPITSIQSEHENTKKNVVLIILESFGRENLNIGATPFLDSLITESYYFENGFANGKLSIDAVPSTLSSIPSLLKHSIITSNYAVNKVNALPKILKEEGYHTSFFHGAFNGSQNFDQYSKVAGFDAYFGKDEYEGPEAFDGRWGIFDEEFLQYFNKTLSTFKEPFFSTIFTISSHNPYIIPEKYTNKFPKGDTKIYETVAYSDFALKRFFDAAKKEDWYKNTFFVITADHTSAGSKNKIYNTNVGKFRIPILFLDPSNENLKGVHEKNFQQIDILPSVLDYLGISKETISFGKSYTSDKDFVVYYLDNIYHVIEGDYYLAFNGTKSLALYNFKKDPLLQENLISMETEKANTLEKFIKAYIQSFNERMINNNLTL